MIFLLMQIMTYSIRCKSEEASDWMDFTQIHCVWSSLHKVGHLMQNIFTSERLRFQLYPSQKCLFFFPIISNSAASSDDCRENSHKVVKTEPLFLKWTSCHFILYTTNTVIKLCAMQKQENFMNADSTAHSICFLLWEI